MSKRRVFKTKAFSRWNTLPDASLCAAAREIEAGSFDADLGKGLVKKRVAYPGRGKSGSARVLVAKKNPNGLIFITGRDKSDPGPDFTDLQVEAAKLLSDAYAKLTIAQLNALVQAKSFLEICGGQEKTS